MAVHLWINETLHIIFYASRVFDVTYDANQIQTSSLNKDKVEDLKLMI